MAAVLTTRIVASVEPAELRPAQVAREFRRLIAEGAKLRCAGAARRQPLRLLSRGYTPKYKIELFDTRFYLTDVRQDSNIRYFVAYVVPGRPRRGRLEIHPRIFYKDVSLQWRAASHFIRSDGENWIGKGDVRRVVKGGYEVTSSMEETTDLPLEMQSALEALIRRVASVRTDHAGVALVLRRAPKDRIEAYRDFTEPRRRAQAERRNLIHGGRSIARFTRKNDPTSLRFVAGYEPDFESGILEIASSQSRLYGGAVERFRILSRNRKIQYLFLASPRHAWIIPPQATTTRAHELRRSHDRRRRRRGPVRPWLRVSLHRQRRGSAGARQPDPRRLRRRDERARRHPRRRLRVARSSARHRRIQAPGRSPARARSASTVSRGRE